MITKQTFTFISDRTGVRWLKCIHLYGGFRRLYTEIGHHIKGSIKSLRKKRRFYRGRKKFYFKRGALTRSILVRQVFQKSYTTRPGYSFKGNVGLLIRKKNILYTSYVFGITNRSLGKRKLFMQVPFVILYVI